MFKNVKKEEITIPAQMSYLTQVRDFIEHIGRKFKYTDKVTNSFKLVVDEACTNIIRHGYRDIKNGEITVKAIVRRLSLTIVIIDQGKSYDPRSANTPDLAKYVDIGKKGGLGILMMRKLMDDIQYAVTERGNEFRLTKYREASHEPALKQRWNALNMKTKYSIIATAAFTIIAALIFLPIFFSVNSDIREELLDVSASNCQSTADNVVSDMLNDDTALLFEKAYSLRNSYPDFMREVFMVDSSGQLMAWGNIGHSYPFERLIIPEDAVIADTIGEVSVYKYTYNDSIIYDLSTEVELTEQSVLGSVHIWVDEASINQMANAKKLRMIIVLLVILVIGYGSLFWLIQRILSSFNSLADWVRQVVHGKVDQDEIDIDASDEIGEIAQAFNEMTTKFREAQVNLMEQQKLQKELQVAQEIQQMLLPSDFPKVDGFEIASYYEAAKEVGGDLFDFVEVDEDTIGICVADVSGKGVPGSLIMTMIRTALRLESRGNKNPADVLARVNRFVADDMKRGMFVTMFYIILDSRNREIHYASAGHNPMILFRESTKQTYYLNPSGFPVGIQLPDLSLFDKKIETDSIRLREDDILVLYTDGITEAMNSKRELFREERFLETIRGNAHLDVGEFIKSINVDLKNFTGGAAQNDDITFVAIKEKMMQGEVIYKLQEELFRLIDSGVMVKDALERLRVSPHHYYKYKDIIERKGMDGLKDFLEDQDVVEKKHLSIEAKTKIFDVIRKHPDYGPKRIAYELRSEQYGNTKIDPNRLYNELIKLRLNTEEKRLRYTEKGGKRRLKQPGTPLLTLDGKVILDFQSSEQEVARQRGSSSKEAEISPPRQDKKQFGTVRTFNIKDDSSEPGKAPATYIHKQAKPFEPSTEAPPQQKEPAAEKPKPAPEKSRRKSKPAKNQKPEAAALNKEKPDQAPQKGRAFTREELLNEVESSMNPEKVAQFFKLVDDDINALEKLIEEAGDNENLESNVKKINLILKIVIRHPLLKELTDIKNLFSQIQQTFAFMEVQFSRMDRQLILTNVKDMLKYLQKDNKFNDYNKLIEAVNEVGLIHHRLTQSAFAGDAQRNKKISQIREKLAQKQIITDKALLDSISREDND